MLGSSTSNTASMSTLPVCRTLRTSCALLVCRASRNCCFSFLTAIFLGHSSSIASQRGNPRSGKPAGSVTNILHTAWRILDKSAQMIIIKELSIPPVKGLLKPSHGRCKRKKDGNEVEGERQQATGESCHREKIAMERN